MKYDMCGGAGHDPEHASHREFQAGCKIVAVIASSENMPGGRAQKPAMSKSLCPENPLSHQYGCGKAGWFWARCHNLRQAAGL